MMNLKNKIYNFGLYGTTIDYLTSEELNKAFETSEIEIIKKEEVEKLKNKFTYKPLNKIKELSNVNSKDIVRLRTNIWRDYMFRNKTVFRSKEYLFIFDYMLKKEEFVSIAEIRQKTNIDPKTMHYICKKLKEQDMIEEISNGTIHSIRIKKQDENTIIIKNEKNLLTKESFMVNENTTIDLIKPIFYNNISVIDQLKLIVKTLPDGCDSRLLHDMIGMKLKTGLKMMYKICAENSDKYCMASEIDYKSNVCRFYYKPMYEEVMQKRIKRIQQVKIDDNMNEDRNLKDYEKLLLNKVQKDKKRKSISASEKEMGLKVIVDKYGSFTMSKEILDELCEITGYKYRYDRKTLFKAAKNAGLEINKKVTSTGWKYEISKIKKEKRINTNNEIINMIRRAIVEDDIFIRIDNGSFLKEWISFNELYFYILEKIKINSKGKCDLQELIYELPVKILYGVSNIKTPNLRYLITYGIWKKHKEIFKEKEFFKKNKLFWRTEGGEVYLDEDVYEVIKILENMSVREYLKLHDDKNKNLISRLISIPSFIKIIKKLENVGLLKLEKEVKNSNTLNNEIKKSYFILKGNINEEMNYKIFYHKNKITMEKEYVEYNRRKYIYYMLINCEYNNFEREVEEIIQKECNEKESNIFLSKLFRKKPIKKKNLQFDWEKKDHREIYLTVKTSIISEKFEDLKKSKKYNFDEIKMVIGHMAKNKIISRDYINNSLLKVKFSVKFNSFFQKYFLQSEISSIEPLFNFYYGRIFKIVENSKSIDLELLLSKLKYLEHFELERFLEVYDYCFEKTKMEEFTIISLKENNPFL